MSNFHWSFYIFKLIVFDICFYLDVTFNNSDIFSFNFSEKLYKSLVESIAIRSSFLSLTKARYFCERLKYSLHIVFLILSSNMMLK